MGATRITPPQPLLLFCARVPFRSFSAHRQAVSTLLNVLYFMKTVITLYRPPRDGFQAPAPERSPLSGGAMWGFVALNLLVGLMAQPIVTAITNGLMMFE